MRYVDKQKGISNVGTGVLDGPYRRGDSRIARYNPSVTAFAVPAPSGRGPSMGKCRKIIARLDCGKPLFVV